MYTGMQFSIDAGFSQVGVRRVHAYLDGESPQSNCIACSQLDGQVENPRSDKFRRMLEGWGGSETTLEPESS